MQPFHGINRIIGMEKAIIIDFVNCDLERKTGYANKQEIPVEDVFKVAQEIFEKGLNVMVYRTSDKKTILFVDNKRFTPR